MPLRIRFQASDVNFAAEFHRLTPRQYMIGWTGAVRRLAENNARRIIGGDFGDEIARQSVQTDERDPLCHTLYLGGEKGYIAEHVHTGGVIRPKNTKFLAIPIDKSVKGLSAREVPGLILVRGKTKKGGDGAFLARPMKRKIKPLFILKRSVTQRARPWWPDSAAVEETTRNFFRNLF